MSERGPNPEAAKAAAADAEAQRNKDSFLIRNVLSGADRDGKDMQAVLDSNPKYAELAKAVLEDDKRNPEKLTLEQLKGQMFQKREQQFGGQTENMWSKTVTVDGKEFPNPFYEASEANAVTKPESQPTKTPEATPPSVTPEQDADKAKADRETRAKDDEGKAKTAVDQILTDWMKEGGEAPDQILGGKKGDGFEPRGTTNIGYGTDSFTSPVGGKNTRDLLAAGRVADARGAETIVHDMAADKPPSMTERIGKGLRKFFGGGEKTSTGVTAAEVPAMSKVDADRLTDMWMANNPENAAGQGIPAAPEGVLHPTTRRETNAGMQGSQSSDVGTPTGDRAGIKAYGEAVRAADAKEQAQDEYKKAA